MRKQKEVHIIGAGIAGLSIAALISQQEQDFHIVIHEAHQSVGGCAGFFARDGYFFDVGATTLSGINNQGPVKQLIEKLALNLTLKHINPGIEIFQNSNDNGLSRWSDTEQWIEQQLAFFSQDFNSNFTATSLKRFWHDIDQINQTLWRISSLSHSFPPKSVSDYLKLITNKSLSDKFTAASLFLSTLDKRHSHLFKCAPSSFQKLIDELLMITVQNNVQNSPSSISAMGLSYANDTYYPLGGVQQFAKELYRYLQSKNVHLHFGSQIKKIEHKREGFLLQNDKEAFHADIVISAVPIWNTARLINDLPKNNIIKAVKGHRPKWGAFSGYYVVKLKKTERINPAHIYSQVYFNRPSPLLTSGSSLFSLSHPEDIKRNKDNKQTLSLSTHIQLSDYAKLLNKNSHKEIKNHIRQYFDQLVIDHYQDALLEIQNCGIGDPLTFQKFTSREQGSVGGIGHHISIPPWKYPQRYSGIKNLYQIGDTTFPGQGVVSVIQGAWGLAQRLLKSQ